VFHVAAHRGDQRSLAQAIPGNPLEAKGVVGIPEDADAIAQPQGAEQPVEVKHRIYGLPLLCEDDRPVTQPEAGAKHLVHQERRKRPGKLGLLPNLSVVNAALVISTDPLDPSMQVEVPSPLLSRQVGIPDEPQMGLEAEGCQCVCQPLDTRREPTGARVGIDTLEGEHVELHGGSAPGDESLTERERWSCCVCRPTASAVLADSTSSAEMPEVK
jgi:hypothetical protein